MPILDDRVGELDAVGNNQRSDVWQNVAFKKIQIINAEGFDLGIESQPAMHQFRDSFDSEVFDGNCSG